MVSRARLSPPALLLALVVLSLDGVRAACNTYELECRTGGGCMNIGYICDHSRHCGDGSDEDPRLCEFWPEQHRSCENGYFFYQHHCFTAEQMCQDSGRARSEDARFCKVVRQGKLLIPSQHEELDLSEKGMDLNRELVSLLSTAVNSSLDQKVPRCPMLYTRVGNQCVSLFSPAKVSWAEARQFCRSIYGDLWVSKDVKSFGSLLEYLREELLTSNYWIGGRFDMDTNSWSWVTDDTPLPLGAPYWAVKYNQTCVARGPPHTDPFSDPPPARPSARCSHYVLSPTERSLGWCSAMTYQHFYYWSDEDCEEALSPLCLLMEPLEGA